MGGDSSHRFLFYSTDAGAASVSVEITGGEHHHLARVLRMSVGDTAYVTNGRGVIVRCRIEELDRSRARLRVIGVEENDPHPRPITLALALLRKEAFERAVEQCTEIGITSCLPFISERSHLKSYSASFLDRLRRVAFSAAKQSFRSLIPQIESPVSFAQLTDRVADASIALVGDETGEALEGLDFSSGLVVIVGPEGGLSSRERDALVAAGARFVRVCPYRLRSETASATLLAAALAGPGGWWSGFRAD